MRFAYADPPYLGCGKRLYGDLHEAAADWDSMDAHIALIERLGREYPDGWALSLSSSSLRVLLPLCPEGSRVLAWVKPFASWKPGPRIFYAWEPVIMAGGRPWKKGEWRTRDWVAATPPVFERRNSTEVPGQKPDTFCFWLFDAFGIHAEDTLDDLFPGSGNVTRALDAWRRQRRLA